ncbi:hypothetical protein FE275_19010 [Pseudomonas koreensis]|nr:hypothetical protein FE275_19010 [Pseudomonas koreensis]
MTAVFLIQMEMSVATLNPVGAGLLAKAVGHSRQMSPDTPLSRASPLPQGDLCSGCGFCDQA